MKTIKKKERKMKKLVFMFVTMVALSFASCGNKTAQSTANDTTVTDTTDTVKADSVIADSTVCVD